EVALGQIEKLNPKLNAFITVTAEQARADARRAEKEVQRGKYRGPLHGIPVAVKDNIWTRGVRTTSGSKFLRDFVPKEDATVFARLRKAGAILVGKTNLHEFAYGVTSENPHYGVVRNPFDPERIPGGSSGGSAVAVAMGMCCAALGTDTGGSIRVPAALCGVVGLKPTFGGVSCYGVTSLAPSLDHVGPIARTADDAAILLDAIYGFDERDPMSERPDSKHEQRRTWKSAAKGKKPLRSIRLGWPKEYFFERVEEDVLAGVKRAIRKLESLGATIEDVSLPHVAESENPSTHIALAEATAYHRAQGWFPTHAAEYGEDVRKRLEAGLDVRAVDYLRAQEVKKLLRADFESAATKVDAILAPTTPITATRIGEKVVRVAGEDEPVRAALIRMNRPANLAGLPALSVPCGKSNRGLPIGIQIIGWKWEEAKLLCIAKALALAGGGTKRSGS
ncbi:MAG: Asp-tRNA(Asn)/Glu-tRNA(Gln) amidotransferase subunit GatA, partial [Acidobacteria bacterium]|nr:Asp-tRNA(Asn)/Glu-tRNA(Gln) amidotransferase subunit GatA [Acidobacteriota bacterium]